VRRFSLHGADVAEQGNKNKEVAHSMQLDIARLKFATKK
jgi:hypothetical protein